MSASSKLFFDALELARLAGFNASNATLQHVFEDGLSHHTALFENANTQFVVKVFRGSKQLSQQALNAQRICSQHGLSPKVLYGNEEQGIVISEYIPSAAIGQQLIQSKANRTQLESIADTLVVLHSLVIESPIRSLGHFDIVGFCAKYVSTAEPSVQKLHALLLPTIVEFQRSKSRVLCHNDLVADNIFCITGNRALFIDWEYAQLNDPWFDLAAIVFYLQLDQHSKGVFLERYFTQQQTTLKNNESDLIRATTVLLWGDVLWHLHTFGNDYKPNLAHKFDWLKRNALAFR